MSRLSLFHAAGLTVSLLTVAAPIAGAQTPTNAPMAGMPPQSASDPMLSMSSSVDLLAPMTQESSGTAWLPASSPMYGKMFMYPDGSMLMLHGAVTPRFSHVSSKRGGSKFGAPNWFMGMYQHPLGERSQIGFRAMLSLDPVTEGGYGYPLLFQTGESWRGQPLHDRQHPHDLFSELSVAYSHLLAPNTSTYAYVGYPGEPAIGPPTFMHRLIAFDLPDAPIGHHWQDATHITFGVATLGFNFGNRFKVEGSLFNGREPDENRYDFDTLRLNSQSGRVFYNPNKNHSFSLGYAFQKNPEGDEVNQHRTTASWIYNQPLGTDANFTTTFSWGQNILPTEEGRSNSFLVEADYQTGRHTVFTRLENIQKSGHELVLPEELHPNKYSVGAYTVGYMYDLTHGKGIDTGVGATLTVNTKPSSLNDFYGTNPAPVGFQVMFRLRPSRTRMGNGMASMPGMSSMPGMNHAGHEGMTMPGAAQGSTPVAAPAPPSTVEPVPNPAPPVPVPAPAPPSSDPTPPAPAPTPTLSVSVATNPAPPKARQKTKVTVTVTGTDNKPVTDATVAASVNMTAMDMGTLKPTFKHIGNGTYQAEMRFSMPGQWRLVVTVTPSSGAAGQTAKKTVDINVAR